MKNWVVIDLDGTLCDCSHRVHLAQSKQWDDFHAGIPMDLAENDVAMFVRLASIERKVLLCTGRDERHRTATLKWLREHDLERYIDDMLMRPNDDRSSDHELKVRLVDEYFGSRQEALDRVLVVLEDRDKVVEAWRNAGFRCWQVQAGAY